MAFIEGVLLPTLRQSGCRDVAILVDANEAAASLQEVQSIAVGRKYRFAPLVAPNGGIFHPKLAYFCCKDFDVLAIASGNLTLPGQSKQLECLDVVRSDQHPLVFRDFATFAATLANRISDTSKQAADLLLQAEQLAKVAFESSKGAITPFPSQPKLIHTVDESASEQIVSICLEQGFQATDITVLSPFHAPDGGPMLNLKSELGAKALHIGLDKGSMVAPFDKKRLQVSKELDFVVPLIGKDVRHLHAKVFEISDGATSMLMTGSINATAQSFNSTKNVEVSLVRLGPNGTFKWEKAIPTKYEPNKFVPAKRKAGFAYLEAYLRADGRILGTLTGTKEPHTHALARILQHHSNVETPDIDVQIKPSGDFSFEVPFELDTSGAVQLVLHAVDLEAQCWLNVEEDLTSTDEERKEKQAIRHILAGEFTDLDVFELFQILTRATQHTPDRTGGQQTASSKREEMGAAEKAQKFSYALWQNSNLHAPTKGLLGIHGLDTLKAFLRWLNKVGSPNDGDVHSSGNSSSGAPKPQFKVVDESDSWSNNIDLNGTLRSVLAGIPVALENKKKLEAGAILATVSGAHSLRLCLKSIWKDERAFKPLLSWLDEFSRFEYADNGHETLMQFVLGVTAVAVGIASKYDAHCPLAVLKDNLLRFNPRWTGQGPTQEELDTALSSEIFVRLPVDVCQVARAALPAIWNAASMDERIETLVKCATDPGYCATDDDEHAYPGAISAIRRLLRIDRKKRHHGIVLNESHLDSSGCPHCYEAFAKAYRIELRAKHFILCPHGNCKKPIFYFEDKAVESRVMEAIKSA